MVERDIARIVMQFCERLSGMGALEKWDQGWGLRKGELVRMKGGVLRCGFVFCFNNCVLERSQ